MQAAFKEAPLKLLTAALPGLVTWHVWHASMAAVPPVPVSGLESRYRKRRTGQLAAVPQLLGSCPASWFSCRYLQAEQGGMAGQHTAWHDAASLLAHPAC